MNLVRMLIAQSTIFLPVILLLLQTACDSQNTTARYDIDLVLKIESDRSSLKSGESMHIRFTTTNTGSRSIIIDSQDTPVLDIVVEEVPSRQRLASWSDRNPDKVSHRVEWKPGESKVMELTWTYSGKASPYADSVGLLSGNSRMLQAASVRLCLEPCR